jgi:hypothetical protein
MQHQLWMHVSVLLAIIILKHAAPELAEAHRIKAPEVAPSSDMLRVS